MKTIKLKIIVFFLLSAALIVLLELSSFLILKLFSRNSFETVTSSFIFEQRNSDGTFTPNYDSVFPIKENFFYHWKNEEFDVVIETNSIGLRENFEVIYEDVKVAFFGDSFTFGHGVNVNQRYSNVFSRYSKFKPSEVVSMSYKNGFQPEHYEFWLKNVNELRPDYIIIGLYLGNDLGSDVTETFYDPVNNNLALPYRLIHEGGQTRLASKALKQPWRLLAQRSNFGLLVVKVIGRSNMRDFLFEKFKGPHSPNNLELELGKSDLSQNRAIQSLLRLRDIAEERQSKLKIVIIPQNFHFTDKYPHIHSDLISSLDKIRSGANLSKQLIEFCEVKNLDCIDLIPLLSASDYFIKDAHWNASGHEKVGKYLAEIIELKHK